MAVWFRGCSVTQPIPKIIKVTVPEVKGNFEPKKPVHELLEKATSKEILQVKNPINQKCIV